MIEREENINIVNDIGMVLIERRLEGDKYFKEHNIG